MPRRFLAEVSQAEVLLLANGAAACLLDNFSVPTLFSNFSMFSRLTQLSQRLTRSFPSYAHPATAVSRSFPHFGIMTSAEERRKRIIHTAGCIIIGDELLGGKVRHCFPAEKVATVLNHADSRYQFRVLCQVLLQPWNEPETCRGHCGR